jgi:hypothetical protein
MAQELTCKGLSVHDYVLMMPGAGEAFDICAIEGDKGEAFRLYALNDPFLLPGGLVIGQQNIVIKDCIVRDPQISSTLALISGGEAAVKLDYSRLEGEFVSLRGPWSNGFWHWMMEFLPKALIAEMFGFKGKYIIPPIVAPYMTQSMQQIGVPTDRLLRLEAGVCVQLERLYMPQRFLPDHGKTYLSILRLLRERLLKDIDRPTDPPGRIYISRRHAPNGRRVINERELIDLLNDFGFQSVYMEHRTLQEQIQLMANANWLIGASGAGMFHSLIMPQSSCVMELLSPLYVNPCMTAAMELLNHNYYLMPSKHVGDYPYGTDVDTPLSLIRLTLRNHFHNEKISENSHVKEAHHGPLHVSQIVP